MLKFLNQYWLTVLADKFIKDNLGNTPFHIAAKNGRIRICEFIMASKIVDKSPTNNNGDTPLHLAAKNGHFGLCKLIAKNVVDKHPTNNQGLTPRNCIENFYNRNINKIF